MSPSIYGDLARFYNLLDPPEGYAAEAAAYLAAFESVLGVDGGTLLELGCGGGHNARHLKARYRCTLTDLNEPMLALSRALNPECEHLCGDMRTLRLGRVFDAVFVHDAVVYMTTEDELRAAIETAWTHTRPGGAAVFAPDYFRETFTEETERYERVDGDRELKGMAWVRDPDPSDCTYVVDYAFLLREGQRVQAVHEQHVEGLFAREVWERLLRDAGFEVDAFERPIGDGAYDRPFVCRRARLSGASGLNRDR